MRVFVTGSTGFIGSHVVPELLGAGHQVLGLSRSAAGAAALRSAGAEVHAGDIEDLDSLRAGAAQCDGVIHLAFDHDFANFVANCAKDGRVIEALGSTLLGTDRPLLITSGTAMGAMVPGQPGREDQFNPDSPNPRVASELAGRALLERGVNVSVVRLSQIHDTRRQGLITELIRAARDKGVATYVGDGGNAWSATHVSDTATLFRLALEKHERGARYNATAEPRIAMRDIANAIGKGLGVPVQSVAPDQAAAYVGWLAEFIGRDMSASNDITRAALAWHPVGPGLLEDLAAMDYDATETTA